MTKNEALQQIIEALKALMDDAPQLEEVRKFLAELSRSGKTSEMKTLLAKYGATKLSDIDPKYYAKLLDDAKEIANA